MIAIIAKAMLSRFLSAMSALIDLVRRYPWQCALAASLALCAWQYHRAGAWETRAHNEALAHRQTKANFAAAMTEWKRQAAIAKATRQRMEQLGKKASHDAQQTFERMEADNADLRDYIAHNRVRRQATVSLDASASGGSAAVPDDATADAVLVHIGGIEQCKQFHDYAAAAHEWAQSLIINGLGKPAQGGK